MKSKYLLRGLALGTFVGFACTSPAAQPPADGFAATTNAVGRNAAGLETPVNQRVTPAGLQIELPGMRPQALALSPDGQLLVTAGLTGELLALDPATGKILQRVSLPADQTPPRAPDAPGVLTPSTKSQLSFTGLVFAPDGSHIYMSNVNGDVKVFGVGPDHAVTPLFSIPLPPANAPERVAEIPAGLAVSPDGKLLFVALNLSNRLAELDAATGRVLHLWDVGVAPFDVALARGKIYVSNWGGRRPGPDSVTGPAGRGTVVRVDARSIASEGSVSVIHPGPEAGTPSTEILAGLHTCALAVSPDGRRLVAANAGSDTLSVIDTVTDAIVETICARQNPADLFGAQPNALTFDRTGKKLYVCNGTQNAVAVFQFQPRNSKLLGLIPVGWFPGAIAYDAGRHQLDVANLKSLPDQMEPARLGNGPGFNTKQYSGSLSLVPLRWATQSGVSNRTAAGRTGHHVELGISPPDELAAFTRTVLANLRYPLLAEAQRPPRARRPAQPVPERVGEPSVFQHVIYIIKENRSYDQVFGDVAAGDGDASLCVFGGRVTPNEHQLVRQFVLLDNTYCCSILSADGHQWADSALATDYDEREFAGWPRSYPAGGSGVEGKDALAYSPAGFIWNDALAHGRTVADFGEFTTAKKQWRDPAKKGDVTFADVWRDYTNGVSSIAYACEPDIEALRPYIVTNTIGWDLDVPDVWRADRFSEQLKQYERAGAMPNLVILWLPNDHTSATKPGSPTPAAQVADNDLAMGRVMDALSHSAFWTNTCLFAIEDDPQNGWDHVSGYRTTAYVVSPYTRRGAVVHTQYNQTSLLRTMELILGLPPMNQMDATATPMFDCFTNTPDFTPYVAVPNNVPLDQMNPPSRRIADAQLRKDAEVSARLPLQEEDQCPEDEFNQILWRAVKGAQEPYPTWAVKAEGDGD
jgi:YVTN family beta-propeller protein